MLKFRVERFTEIAHELPPLFQRHFDEIAHDKEEIPLAPDWAHYAEIDKTGQLFVLTARDGGRLVGYFFAIVGKGLHNARSIMARTDMYYLLPEYRKGRNGYTLIKTAVEKMSFDKMSIATKLDHDQGAIFRRLGFRPAETVWTRLG